ncbi:MAG: molybdenum cofactor guanylyltransferase MobA [Pseudomonas sp.]
MSDKVTLAILAGGQGRRLQGRDKGLISILGQGLVERTLHTLADGMPGLIVANRNLSAYRALGVAVVADPWPDFRGPLAGILAALRAARTPWVQIVPCDAALLPGDLLSRLMARAGDELSAVYAEWRGQGQYLCCLLNRNLAVHLADALERGERAPCRWLASIGAQSVDFSDVQPEPLWSMNNPAEVAAARARLGHGQ